MKKVKVKISWSGDNYVAVCEEVNGTVMVTHKNYEKLLVEFKEAFQVHIEASVEDGDKIPKYILENKFEFDYELLTSAILQKIGSVISLSAIHKVTGINEKQLSHYRSGLKNPRLEQRKKIIEGLHAIGKELLAV